jgi:hypothetical protein
LVGDTGVSGPENWIDGFGKGGDHVLVTLHAMSSDAMNSYSDRLSALFSEGDAFRELWRCDGTAWTETKDGNPGFTHKVPFGYTDSISMTSIRGGPERYTPDHQQPCEPWLFVLREGTKPKLLSSRFARLALLSKSHLQGEAAEATYFDDTGNSMSDSTSLGSINRARWQGEVASRKARLHASSTENQSPQSAAYVG